MRMGIFMACLFLMLLVAVAHAEPDGSEDSDRRDAYAYVDHYGYRYLYRTDDKGGTIEITEPCTNRLVFRQSSLQIAGCPGSNFDSPRALRYTPVKKEEIVGFCGDDGGVMPEMLFFKQGRFLAKLEYDASDPNLVWHPEYGSYLAVADIREGIRVLGMAYLMRVYEWKGDSSEFRLIFNSHSYRLYRAAYEFYKQSDEYGEPRDLSMLAMLIATSKASLICSEMNSPPLNQLQPKQIRKYLDIIESHGFPSFDFSVCKGGSRK